MRSEASILFLSKNDDEHCARALRFLQSGFGNVTAAFSSWGQPLPPEVLNWSGDYIVSYLCRWIVPRSLLASARRAALNFHPAPPEYPGVGCLNFALYEQSPFYGVTCHHMAPAVDTGPIVAVRRFPVLPSDDVALLLERTHVQLLTLFYDVISDLLLERPLPESGDRWSRRSFTRLELDQLAQIAPDAAPEEVARRVRATAFGPWRPFVEIAGHRFELAGKSP